MNILKLASYYSPEQFSSMHLNRDVENAYATAGFKMVIFTPIPTRGVPKEVRREYKTRKYEEIMNGAIQIHRFYMFKEWSNPVQRAFRYFFVNIIHYWKGIHSKDIDVITAGSTPPTQGLLCGLIKKRLSKKCGRCIPFVYILQDIFPESLVTAGLTHEGSLLWKIGKSIANYSYCSADKIIVLSNTFKERLLEGHVPEEKISVVYNWIDTTSVCPIERENNKLYDELNLPRDKFYITYAGNLGATQGIETILYAAKQLNDNDQIRIVFFGGGTEEDKYKRLSFELGLTNTSFFPLLPLERVSEVYSLGDASIVACKIGAGGSVLPSKTWSIMSAGRPVIASFDLDSELCQIISDNQCGICVESGNATALSKAILSASKNQYDLKSMGMRGRNFICTNLTARNATRKYIDILQSVVDEQRERSNV